MATQVKIKRRTADATAPTGLTAGEMAINLVDKKLYVGGTAGTNTIFLDSTAVAGLSTANTFTALNTFSAGISAANGVTFAKDIRVNSLTIGVGNDPLNHGVDTSNTAIGYQALLNTNGDENEGEGVSNTAVGQEVLKSNTTGSTNTGLGAYSLHSNTTGSNNTGVGSSALRQLTTASQMTAIGYVAGYYRGSGVSTLTTGTGGIFIGYQARGSTNGQTNEIVIGVDALGLGSNTAVIGATLQSAATIYGVLNLPSGLSAAGATFTGNISAPNIVSSFNGVTGAVTGASLGANTFTQLNTFSAGISASGATFTGSIVLQNLEKIQNTTNGRIDFQPGPTAGTAYGIYFDTTSYTVGVNVGTISSANVLNDAVGGIQFECPLTIATDKFLNFNTSSSYRMISTTQGNDTLQIGLYANNTHSNSLALVDLFHMEHSYRSPGTTHANPNLYIYRAGITSANDYIRFEHDGTNGNIVTGAGGISIMPNDSAETVKFGDGGFKVGNSDPTRYLNISSNFGNSEITQMGASSRTMKISHAGFGSIYIGDSDGNNNSTYIDVNDNNSTITLNGAVTANEVTADAYILSSSGISAKTASYTLVATDNGKIITMNVATANNLTVPASLDVGFNCTVIQLGAGQTTITASSTTLNSYLGYLKITGQHGSASIVSYASNVYNVAGSLSA